jgi:hypothetical protein
VQANLPAPPSWRHRPSARATLARPRPAVAGRCRPPRAQEHVAAQRVHGCHALCTAAGGALLRAAAAVLCAHGCHALCTAAGGALRTVLWLQRWGPPSASPYTVAVSSQRASSHRAAGALQCPPSTPLATAPRERCSVCCVCMCSMQASDLRRGCMHAERLRCGVMRPPTCEDRPWVPQNTP